MLRRSSSVTEEEPISKDQQELQPITSSESIFRRQASSIDSELEDMWSLKRANPVLSMLLDDDDDEESVSAEAEQYCSPTKRPRTQVLAWEDQGSLPFAFSMDRSL